MELQKSQEARQAQRKTDGSATTGATRPHERPATTSIIPKPSAEKTQEVKRPATAPASKVSEPVKTTVIKERPLSSGVSDRKATQPTQTVHRPVSYTHLDVYKRQEILYAEHDNLTSRQTVDKFIDRHCANLTVMNDGGTDVRIPASATEYPVPSA